MTCIRKRRNKWVVDYRLGGRRQVPSFDTKGEAEAFKRELLLRPIDQQLGYQEIKSITIELAVEQYLTTVTPLKAERTWNVDRLALSEVSKEFKGNLVWQISNIDIESFQIQSAKKLNPATVNRRFNTIRNFFRKCVEWKYCRDNPTVYVKRLAESPKQRMPLTAQQISMLLANVPEWVSNVLFFIAKTGIRRGEACDLTWNNVNLTERVVTIHSRKGGYTRSRDIPLTDQLYGLMLSLWNIRQKSSDKQSHVFLGPTGNFIQRANLSKAVTSTGKRLGIKNAGLHILRHTILTGLAEQNQSGSTIQRLAGHSNLATTQRYIHHDLETLRQTLEDYEKKVILVQPQATSETNGRQW